MGARFRYGNDQSGIDYLVSIGNELICICRFGAACNFAINCRQCAYLGDICGSVGSESAFRDFCRLDRAALLSFELASAALIRLFQRRHHDGVFSKAFSAGKALSPAMRLPDGRSYCRTGRSALGGTIQNCLRASGPCFFSWQRDISWVRLPSAWRFLLLCVYYLR